jgi:hypothetical protein
MGAPAYVDVWLATPTVPYTNITSYLTQESAASITSAIENPTQLGTFTAPEVTLKGYDPTGVVRGLLSGITPLSTNYILGLTLAVVDPTTGVMNRDLQQALYIVPNTLQLDPVVSSFQFTAVGLAHLLTTTPAEWNPSAGTGIYSLTRFSLGYTDTKWTLQQDGSPLDQVIRITAASNASCELQGGDQIKIGNAETFTIVGVQQDSSTTPPSYFAITLNAALQNAYPVGASIVLLTTYMRNVSLHSLVQTLFSAAGVTPEFFFDSAPLPFLTTPFLSPVNVNGLPGGGGVTGIVPSPFGLPAPLAVTVPGQVYQQSPAGPTNPFVPLAPRRDPPIDPTNWGTTYVYTGQRSVRTRAGTPRLGLNVTLTYYAYDSVQYGSTQNRYNYTVTQNSDAASPYNFSTSLVWETYNLATDSWVAQATLWAGVSSTTSTALNTIAQGRGLGLGIAVDPATGTIFFTDLDVASAGGPITVNVSSYQPTGATPATGTLTRNRATNVHGVPVFTAPGVLAVVQGDGAMGVAPQTLVYNVVANGTMTLAATISTSPWLVSNSIKKNRGDGFWYGLVSDTVSGVSLLRWKDAYLTTDPSWTPAALLGAPPQGGAGTLAVAPWVVDLCSTPTAAGPGTGQYPIYALIGGTVYFVSTTGSGVVPYADMTGLSVGAALSQLTVLTAGIFYCEEGFTGWVFRSRSDPTWNALAAGLIYSDDLLDHSHTGVVVSLSTQSVYTQWVGYVSVSNSNDPAIFGQAGNPAYSQANAGNVTSDAPAYSLELQVQFVTTASFAAALAASLFAYLGAQKRVIDVVVQRDGYRQYVVGRTFRMTIDGVLRRFQIIQSQMEMCGSTAHITGLEV